MNLEINQKILLTGACLLFLLLTTGCLQVGQQVGRITPKLNESFYLSPGDSVLVKFFYENNLNDEVVIRPDGKISLQLVGQIKAAGLTPEQLESVLSQKYSEVMYPDCLVSGSHKISPYALAVGSDISLKFFRNSELNENLIIRPDGKISIPLIGEIKAAGLTPNELEIQLSSKYTKVFPSEEQHLINVEGMSGKIHEPREVTVIVRDFKLPELTVSVINSTNRRVFVTGEIKNPGFISMESGMLRVFDAIINAGGTLESAELNEIVLIRSNGTQYPDIYSVNLRNIISGKEPNFMLSPYDIVYVPKTFIANVAAFVNQYIHSIIPVQFNSIYNVNPSDEVKVKN